MKGTLNNSMRRPTTSMLTLLATLVTLTISLPTMNASAQNSASCSDKLAEAKRIASDAIDNAVNARLFAHAERENADTLRKQRDGYREQRDECRVQRSEKAAQVAGLKTRVLASDSKTDALSVALSARQAKIRTLSIQRWVWLGAGSLIGAGGLILASAVVQSDTFTTYLGGGLTALGVTAFTISGVF